MLTNVTRTVRNGRIVTLPRSVEKEEDCINAASGKSNSIEMEYFAKYTFCQKGGTKYFAMSADFVVFCLSVPTRMEHIS